MCCCESAQKYQLRLCPVVGRSVLASYLEYLGPWDPSCLEAQIWEPGITTRSALNVAGVSGSSVQCKRYCIAMGESITEGRS